MNARAIVFLLFWPAIAFAQGFSGLGSTVEGFEAPRPGHQLSFPQDHGAHPRYRIEWWYLTANLEAEDSTPYGLQWTLFRTALSPDAVDGWQSRQIWFGHAAVTTPDAHYATERFARGGIGQAGVNVAPFEAWIDEWTMQGDDFDRMSLNAQGPDFAFDMALTAQGPLVFHGEAGYSVKSDKGQASYYYSQPFFDITGTLTLPSGPVEVSGEAWLDREWSSQPLSGSQSGWDWFSLSFEGDGKLMGFRLRDDDGSFYTAATWIDPNGETTAYPSGAFQAEPLAQSQVAGRDIPTKWRVRLLDKGVDVVAEALNPDAWMGLSVSYWEGPVFVQGSHTGRGYLEMTGYE